MPSKLSSASALVPILPSSSPPLVWLPMASGRHFCAHVQQGRGAAKTQARRKGHLKARHGVLRPHGYPYIPSPKNAAHRPPEARAWHKATPAHSIRSKPGHYHLLRAMDSTAQRSLSASHQAQASLSQTFTCHTATSCLNGQNLFPSAVIVVSPPESRWHSCLHPSKNHSRIVPARMIVVTPPPQQTLRSALQAAFGRESCRGAFQA